MCLGQYLYQDRVTSGKIPTRVPTKSFAIGSALRHGTWSCKNLMKARLECQSIKSMRWAVKKIPVQMVMRCDKVRGHCSDIKILLSSRGAREENFKGAIVGVLGSTMYIYVYIGPEAQSEDVKQSEEGQTQLKESVLVSENVSFDHKGP